MIVAVIVKSNPHADSKFLQIRHPRFVLHVLQKGKFIKMEEMLYVSYRCGNKLVVIH